MVFKALANQTLPVTLNLIFFFIEKTLRANLRKNDSEYIINLRYCCLVKT